MDKLASVWSFLAVVVIAWITQRIILSDEKRKKVDETKLSIYISWMPFFAESYARCLEPNGKPFDRHEFIRKKTEILGISQIMGPGEAMGAFLTFCDLAKKGIQRNPSFDGKTFHESFAALNYYLCCEIHGKRTKNTT